MNLSGNSPLSSSDVFTAIYIQRTLKGRSATLFSHHLFASVLVIAGLIWIVGIAVAQNYSVLHVPFTMPIPATCILDNGDHCSRIDWIRRPSPTLG